MTSEPARQLIADSRALYFSDLIQPVAENEKERDSGLRKPSYVGLSHSINGYTPYAPYNGRLKKISPPSQIPVSPPKNLDSVKLVLNQDNYQKSLVEFESVMRDLSNTNIDMRQPDQSSDVTDHVRVSDVHHQGDDFFPKTHSRQLIGDGEGAVVEIVTKFHSDGDHTPTYRSPSGSSQNLVQKQIERLYGDSTISQIKMTTPDASESTESSSESQSNGKPERKISGGFFAKRFGVTKMKDRSTKRQIDNSSTDDSPMEFKPLKVPAVFRLLRPEFREQLRNSSCLIKMPLVEEQGKERVIPIKREDANGKLTSANGVPVSNSIEEPTNVKERVVPINIIGNGVTVNNNNNIKDSNNHTPERIIPIKKENGIASITPKRPTGLTPKVNGFSPEKQASLLGLRNGTSSKPSKDESEQRKPNVVRKLSPLSPKHIMVPTSAEKPAPMPKPDYLKSPPISPTPGSPTSPPLARQRLNVKQGVPLLPNEPSDPPLRQNTKISTQETPVQLNGDIDPPQAEVVPPSSSVADPSIIPDAITNSETPLSDKTISQDDLDISYEEYERTGDDFESPEQVYLHMQQNRNEEEQDYYYDQSQICGLRERELLCPIIEEDNESTASGSISNLASSQRSNVNLSGVDMTNSYCPDDPLLISETGEIQDGNYFLKVLENEIFKFEEQICDWEEELNSGQEINEEARDTILTVIGMAKLLMAQKLTQFRGLCDKNLNVSRDEDPFVPTGQDLAGFWDMVHIQVEQIHTRFKGLHELKSNGWTVKTPEIKNNKNKTKKNVGVNKPIKSKEKSEAAKKRDEARKKMMEERKKAMKEKAQKKEDDNDLIIIM